MDEAVRLQSPRGAVYVAGSEEFFLAVKSLSRPDLIPRVYADACKAMAQGQPYVNRYHVSDFNKGVDPTFSEIRRLLPDIDRACQTHLEATVARLEAQVAPFPFLRLPAELRLQVYSYVLPQEPRAIPPPWHRKVARPRLVLMCVNRQMHSEVRKYFYERVGLSLPSLFHFENTRLFEDHVPSVRETIATMDPDIFPLFKQLTIHMTCSSPVGTFRMQCTQPSSVLKYLFETFTGLERLVISFGSPPSSYSWAGEDEWSTPQQCVPQMRAQLIDQIPDSVKVSWSREDAARFFHSEAVERCLWRAIQERGSADDE